MSNSNNKSYEDSASPRLPPYASSSGRVFIPSYRDVAASRGHGSPAPGFSQFARTVPSSSLVFPSLPGTIMRQQISAAALDRNAGLITSSSSGSNLSVVSRARASLHSFQFINQFHGSAGLAITAARVAPPTTATNNGSSFQYSFRTNAYGQRRS